MTNPCKHFQCVGPGQYITGTATVGPWNCPWCEVEQLKAENAELLRWQLEARKLMQGTAVEPSGCPEHGMEHFFEGMCIKCGVVPAAKSGEQS